MAKILIEPAKARNVLGSEDSLENSLRSFLQDVDSVRRGLRYKIAGEEQISARLKEAAAQLTKEATATRAMHSGLDQVIQRYEQTENGNAGRAKAEKTSIQSRGVGVDIPNDQSTGNEDTTDDSFLTFIKSLLTWADKTDSSDTAGITKDAISYLESLYKFFSGDKRGLTGAKDWFDLGDKSIGVWKEFYKYLKNFYHGYGNTFSMANQRGVAGLGIFGGVFGLLSTAFGVTDQINNVEKIGPAGIMGEILGGGDDVVDIWSDVEKLKHLGDSAANITAESGVYSPLSFYSAIAKGYLSAFSQGFKSYEKYMADGSWDMGDTGKTGVEFGVSGLCSMADALSFNLFNLSDAADNISEYLEGWADGIGKRAGNYILENPGLHKAYKNSGPLGQAAISFYSAFASAFT